MKRLKNNKGITLMELLAVVVILGILTTVAIGPISKLLDKSNKNYYKNIEDNIILAAQSYLNDNRDKLPLKKGDSEILFLQELLDSSYIKSVKDKNGKSDCTANIKVTKKGKNYYDYEVCYLHCDDYETSNSCSI